MSDDEIVVLVASAILSGFAVVNWYAQVSTRSLAAYPGHWRSWLGVAPLAAIAGIFVVLLTIAAQDVRTASQYILLYLLLGAAWIFGAVRLMAMYGVSFRDDALQRRNPAAAIAVISVILAHAAIYSGANVGDGPGWWCVVAAGTVGTVAWFVLWSLIESVCQASEQITVGRDVPVAIRLGGYMVASGIICGRGVAGDWESIANTISDFREAWPVVPLAAAAIIVEFALRGRSQTRGSIGLSAAIALAYLVVAAAAVASSPPLSSNPLYPLPAPNQ